MRKSNPNWISTAPSSAIGNNQKDPEPVFDDDEIINIDQPKEEDAAPDQLASIESKIKIKITLKNEAIKRDNNKKQTVTMPMMVSIEAGEIQAESKASIDIVCVLDKSGSMKGEKWDLLKSSLVTMMEYLGEKDRMSIVTFDSSATRLTPLLQMNSNGKEKVIKSLAGVNANGGTDIAEGTRIALEVLKQRKLINKVSSILILSDGLDTIAERKLSQILPYYKSISIFTFNTFGYGADHDPLLMSNISAMKDGSFYFIDKLEKVDECFIDCVGGLVSVIGEDVRLCVQALNGIEIDKSYGEKFIFLPNINEYHAKIFHLLSGKTLDYIFDINIPVHNLPEIFAVAFATVDIKSVDVSTTISKVCGGQLKIVDDPNFIPVDNQKVILNYYRVRTGDTTKHAKDLADDNQFDVAKREMTALLEEMNNSQFKDLLDPFIKDVEAAIENLRPENYQNVGRHYIIENARSNINQASNVNSRHQYSNNIQSEFRSRRK